MLQPSSIVNFFRYVGLGRPTYHTGIYNIMKIPGVTFSLKRAVGVTKVKQKIARATGIPLTRQGLERKIGGAVLKAVTGKKRR